MKFNLILILQVLFLSILPNGTNTNSVFNLPTNAFQYISSAFEEPEAALKLQENKMFQKKILKISVAKKKFKKLQNEKIKSVKDAVVEFCGQKIEIKSLKIRGNNSRTFKRQSLNVKLDEAIVIRDGEEIRKLQHFNLISLNMDKNYFRNRFAFKLMNRLGFFPLFNTYIELKVNEKTQGIYLLIEKPHKYAINEAGSDFIMRRAYRQSIDKFHNADNIDEKTLDAYQKSFYDIYTAVETLQGATFLESVSEKLDIDQYMRWMAFNYLICNGDYTDEVYFYANAENKKFQLIPWDYDDIFMAKPHEGGLARSLMASPERMVFSVEDKLDLKIANDEYLYNRYLDVLDEVTETINNETFKATLEGVYQELYPYFMDNDCIKMSKYDRSGQTNINLLQADLLAVYEVLTKRHEKTVSKIVADNKK